MCRSLKDRLNAVEDEFLSSVEQGPEAVEAFNLSCTSLQKSFSDAVDRQLVDEDTATLAHLVFTKIAILASQFIVLNEEMDAVSLSLQEDLDQMFSRLDILENHAPAARTSTSETEPSSTPPYIAPAYLWILSNLANPYPPREVKASIAHKANCSVKDIDNWFINVRKRIGWNDLRVKQFSNKRSLIVEGATRFFASSVPSSSSGTVLDNRTVDPSTAHSFATIAVRAENLYQRKTLGTSAVVNNKLATATPPRRHGRRRRRVSCDDGNSSEDCVSSYPTPERSLERAVSQGSAAKRRRTSAPDSDSTPHTTKRSRNTSSSDPILTSLPSPAATLCDDSSDCPQTPTGTPETTSSTISAVPIISNTSSVKRKRRLSEVDERGPAKRPHNVPPRPLLQSVSNPLPLETSSDLQENEIQEFDFTVEFPPLVAEMPIDNSAQLDVSVYEYDFSPYMSEPALSPVPAIHELASLFDLSDQNTTDESSTNGNLESTIFSFANDVQVNSIDFNTSSFEFSSVPSHFSTEQGHPTHPSLIDSELTMPSHWCSLGPSIDYFNSALSPVSYEPAIFSSHNSLYPVTTMVGDDKNAKLERVRLLKAELQRLEAET